MPRASTVLQFVQIPFQLSLSSGVGITLKHSEQLFGGIGLLNKEDSTRKGGEGTFPRVMTPLRQSRESVWAAACSVSKDRPFAVTKAQRLPHSVRFRLSCATHERQLPVARH